MPCCTPASVAGHRLKTVPSSPRSSKRGHNARFSRRFQYGVTGRIPRTDPPARVPVQEQLRSTHQEGVQTQEVIHTVSPPRLYPGWVNIGWKRWVRIRWKSTLCPWVGRHTERARVCLGWFRPVNRVGACRNLRQGSGVHTHRQVVAGPVCRGIVMCAAINAMLRQPALLLQFAGPSLRRAVTALSALRRTQRIEPCSSMRVPWACWQHSAVSHASDDLPDGQRWRL